MSLSEVMERGGKCIFLIPTWLQLILIIFFALFLKRDFSRVTKILHWSRTNLLINETIVSTTEINAQACVRLWTLYKVFIPAKANMFLLRGKVCTMKHHSHAILYKDSGAPSGGPTTSNSAGARQLHHWLSFGWRHPVISALSSHPTSNQTLLLASLICFVYRATWPCIWSAREYACQWRRPDGLALITVLRVTITSCERWLFEASEGLWDVLKMKCLVSVTGTAENQENKIN